MYHYARSYDEKDFLPKGPPSKLEVDVFFCRKHKRWPYKIAIVSIEDGIVLGCNNLREGLNMLRKAYPDSDFYFKLEKQTCLKSFNI